VVTSDLVLLTQAGIKTEFNGAYNKAQETAVWREIASEIPTTLPIQNYAWLGRGALMEQFFDEVKAQGVREIDYKIADILYKGAFKVQRKALEDDQYGLLMMKARGEGKEPVRHWNQLAYTALPNGFSTACYDLQNFFSASHQEGSSPTQSNTTNAPLSDASLEAAYTSMMGIVDDKGIPMEIIPDTLVVGPALTKRAWQLTGQDVRVINVGDGTAGSGATAATPMGNFFKGRIKRVIENPYLINATFNGVAYTAAYNWFLLDTSREVKPIVIQNREDVPITLETDMDQPSQKIKEEYLFTIRGRYAQGYGLWQLAYGSSATA
jgi:phage major head subunit gpT-like protein